MCKKVICLVSFVLVLGLAAGVACGAVFRSEGASNRRVYGRGAVEFEVKSDFSHIRVRRQGSILTLLFVSDGGLEVVESAVDLESPHDLLVPYSRFMFASYLFRPKHKRVLVVGLGGGAMIHFLRHYAPQQRVDVVEIDPAVVKVADEYFGIRPGENLRIITADGFRYLTETEERYDVIYMDAFLGPSPETDRTGIPLRLKTVRFLKGIRSKLAPKGLVVFNLHRVGTIKDDTKAIRDAFPQTYVFPVPRRGNRIVVASLAETREEQSVLSQRARQLDRDSRAGFSFEEIARNLIRQGEPSAIELPVLDVELAFYRPTAEITSPVKDYFDSGESIPLEAQATAYGGSKVQRVEFIVDGITIASDTDAPYVFNWIGAVKGRHSIKAKVYDSKGRTKESFPMTIFVGMRALERSVSRSTDDAEENANGSMYTNSSDLELINDGRRGDQIVGMRFADLQLPKGISIKKAYLQFTADGVSTESTDLTIYAELVTNAETFTQVKGNISSRKRTKASVKWSPEPWNVPWQRSEKQRTPDLFSLIQEVVAQPGWREGNALVFIIAGSGNRDAVSFDGARRYAPMLHIEY